MLKRFLGFSGYFLLALLFVAVLVVSANAQILSQLPTQTNGAYSDPDCDTCGGSQIMAENFVMNTAATIFQIRLWGAWDLDSAPPDNFTVIFHNDASGLPGTNAASPESNVPSSRLNTGLTVSGRTEYENTLTLANPVTLGPGTYWVEIYNDSTGSADSYFWEWGTLDPVNGIANSAGDTTNVPGSSWSPYNDNFAIEILTTPPAPSVSVPTMTQWGMIIFTVFAGIGSVFYIRRKRIKA